MAQGLLLLGVFSKQEFSQQAAFQTSAQDLVSG
jgi:hypothetical protein